MTLATATVTNISSLPREGGYAFISTVWSDGYVVTRVESVRTGHKDGFHLAESEDRIGSNEPSPADAICRNIDRLEDTYFTRTEQEQS